MSCAHLTDIPKIIVGNPEVAGIGYDFLPDYRPTLAPGFEWRDGALYFEAHELSLEPDQSAVLGRIDSVRTLHDICDFWSRRTEAPISRAAPEVIDLLKWARMRGIVRRDNSLAASSFFLRIRTFRAAGEPDAQRWIYLPAQAHRVLTLCSGAHSCREIAEILLTEREEEAEKGAVLRKAHEVERAVEILVANRVVCWLDDEKTRFSRLSELFLDNQKGS